MSFWASDFWAEGFWAEGFWVGLGATTAGTPDLIAIQIPLTMVKEETGFTAKVYFRNRATSTDETPTTARYRIDCKTTGKTVQDWTSVTTTVDKYLLLQSGGYLLLQSGGRLLLGKEVIDGSLSTISIPILPRHSRILSFYGVDSERKQLIVESNTDTDTAYSGSVTWTVKNVHGVN